jgi:PAS domain S-box-containing protein/putative nucleotidyltransferase with HDIG domain
MYQKKMDEIAYLHLMESLGDKMPDGNRILPIQNGSVKGLELLIEEIHSAILFINQHGKILFANSKSTREFGFSIGDLVIFELADNQIRNSNDTSKTGSAVTYSTILEMFFHQEKGFLLILDDRDSRKNAGKTKSEEPQTLQHPLPGMAYESLIDQTHTMKIMGEGCFELTGYKPEDLIDNNRLAYANLIHLDDKDRVTSEIQQALILEKPFNLRYRIHTASGVYRLVQDQGKGIMASNGKHLILSGWISNAPEQNNVDSALQESEQIYRTLVEASPDAVILAGMDGTILLANRQSWKLLGVDHELEMVGMNILKFLAPNSKSKSEREIIRGLTGENAHRGSYWVKTLTGNQIPVDVSVRVIYDAEGNRNGYIGVVRDMSEREVTLQALKTSEARYRAIVENNPEMIVRYSPEGLITFANQSYGSFYGLESNNIIGKRLLDVIPESSRPTIERILRFVTPDMPMAVKEHSAKNQSGEIEWYRWKTQPILNDLGEFIEYQSIGENITIEKKAQQSINQSEQHLRELMETIKLIAIIMDTHGIVSFCNSHFLEVTGWSKEEVIEKNWLEKFVPPDVASKLSKILLETVINGKIAQRYENMILTRKGEQRLISWNNTILRDNHGIPQGIASIGEDITEKFYSDKTQEVIYKIAQSSMAAINLDELYVSIHKALLGLMPADNFFIALYDPKTNLLSFPYYVDQFDTQPEPKELGRGLTEYVLRTGTTLLANPEVFNLLIEENEVESVGAPSVDWLGAPLIIENKVIGVMGTQSYTEGVRFQKRDEQMLAFVSTQVAMAIERKRSEQALNLSRKRNELLVEASTDGILLETLDGRILDTNYIVEKMYGYTHDELISMRVSDLVSPEFVVDKPNYVVWELEEGGILTDIPNIRKDGTIFPVEVSTRLTTTENDQFVVAYIRDITERKQVEQAIIESEAKFRTLAQTAAAGIYIHEDGSYLYVNPMWVEITGYDEKDLMQMSYWDLISPEERPGIQKQYKNLLQGETSIVRYETLIQSKSGKKKWVDITAGVLDYEGQKATIGTAIDITFRKQKEHELEVVAKISEALRVALTREEIRPTVLREIMNLLEIDGALISTIEKGKELHSLLRAVGVWAELDKRNLKVGEGLSGYITVSGKTYINHHASHDPHVSFPELVQKLTSLVGVPLITKGETIGALLVGSAHVLRDDEIRLLRTIGDMTASAIHRSDLYEQTSLQAHELKQAYDATLEGWAHALELRDKETQGHSLRIANMTLKLAKRLGYKDEDLENVRRGALLHDIGKMGVPDTILLKPGSLNEEEWVIMQKHPVYAYQMLIDLPYFKQALDIPYAHHEWWDGSGYPRGLKEKEIPLIARIFAIVDAWDALISDRPYRKAWLKRNALSHIIDQSGTHFDPEVVNTFVQMLREEKNVI